MNPCKVNEAQTEVQRLFNLLSHFLAQAIPLIDHNHQRAAAVEDKTEQRKILVGNPFTRIDNQHHHVGIFNGLQRFDDREFFDHVGNFTALTHARGVDEHVFTFVALHRNVDTVARSPRHVVDHHAVFAEDTVGQRGFPHVRTADNRQLNRQILRVEVVFWLFRFFTVLFRFKLRPVRRIFIDLFRRVDLFGPRQQDVLQQAGHAATVRRSDRMDIAEAQ